MPQHTILIVEDEPDTAEMFAEMMRLTGFRVIKTYGGAAAMKILGQEHPNALVLDLMMPDISGLEVLRYIRRDPGLMKIPVIVVSAKSMPSDVQGVLEAGATTYLTKPVSFLDLRQAVLQAIQGINQADNRTQQEILGDSARDRLCQ